MNINKRNLHPAQADKRGGGYRRATPSGVLNLAEKRRRLNFLCAVAGRALPGLGPVERIRLYEAFALVFPEKRSAQQAAFTAFVLARSEAAQAAMAALLHQL